MVNVGDVDNMDNLCLQSTQTTDNVYRLRRPCLRRLQSEIRRKHGSQFDFFDDNMDQILKLSDYNMDRNLNFPTTTWISIGIFRRQHGSKCEFSDAIVDRNQNFRRQYGSNFKFFWRQNRQPCSVESFEPFLSLKFWAMIFSKILSHVFVEK